MGMNESTSWLIIVLILVTIINFRCILWNIIRPRLSLFKWPSCWSLVFNNLWLLSRILVHSICLFYFNVLSLRNCRPEICWGIMLTKILIFVSLLAWSSNIFRNAVRRILLFIWKTKLMFDHHCSIIEIIRVVVCYHCFIIAVSPFCDIEIEINALVIHN